MSCLLILPDLDQSREGENLEAATVKMALPSHVSSACCPCSPKSFTYLHNHLGNSCSGAIMQVKHTFSDRKDSKQPFAFVKLCKAVSVQTLL